MVDVQVQKNVKLGNCIECDTIDELCKKCDEGLYPDENGGCSYSN